MAILKTANAFAVQQRQQQLSSIGGCGALSRYSSTLPASSMTCTPSTSSRNRAILMMSDFPSAMPEKPELSVREKMAEAATEFITTLTSRLADGVEPPPELEALRKARDSDADVKVLATLIYELMIEQGMLYDQDPDDGSMSPTDFDIKSNLDVPEVKKEFLYLYKYGMNMIKNGLIETEDAKTIVKERLIDRTGLSPEEFDKWLGY